MQAKTKERIGKIGFKAITIIGVMMFLCLIQLGSSFEFAISSESPNIYEDETLILNLSILEVNGTLNFTKNVSFGELNKVNETLLQFNWIPEQALLTNKTNTFSVLFNVSDNSSSLSKEVTITVTKRNDPPRIINSTLGGLIYQSRAEIFLELDRQSVCKYSLSNKSYSSMEYTFNSDESKIIHNTTTPFMSQGTKRIYILCRDFSENYMETPHVITFDVNLAPTAEIYLEPSPPLKSERVYVELIASEDLASAPELSYIFDDDSSPKIVSLVGSKRRWEGYMIIRGTNIERVGSFSFKGVDLTGIEGTEITKGKLFLIDTNKPGPVQSIEVTNQYDRTRIAWAYSLEKNYNIVEYRIYRRVDSGGVDYVDYYKSTSNNYFYDKDVEFKKSYYYRVSAVDDAGNEGELSKEVFTTFIPDLPEETVENTNSEEEYKLSPALQIALETKIDAVDKIILDLEKQEEYFKRITGTENIEVIQSLGLISQVAFAKTKVEEIKEDLVNLKLHNLSDENFADSVDMLLAQAELEFNKAPSKITLIDSSSYQEFIDESLIKEIANEYIDAEGNDIIALEELLENSISLQEQITVNALLIESEITYPNQTLNVKTVKKTLNARETINNAIIVESLPKSLDYDFSSMIIDSEPLLNEANDMVWEEPKLSKKTIVYSLVDYPDFTTLKESKLVVLGIKNDETNVSDITGLAISESQEKMSPLIIPIIIGIILAGILGVYYFVSSRKDNESQISNPFNRAEKESLKELLTDFHIGKRKQSYPKANEDKKKLLRIEEEEVDYKKNSGYVFDKKSVRNTLNETELLESELIDSIKGKDLDYDGAHEPAIEKNRFGSITQSNSNQNINTNNSAFNIPKGPTPDLDIHKIYQHILKYKTAVEGGKDINIKEMQEIKETLQKIKSTCDEIDKARVESYTEKAKSYLKETLKYLESMEFSKDVKIKETATKRKKKSLIQKSKLRDLSYIKPKRARRARLQPDNNKAFKDTSRQVDKPNSKELKERQIIQKIDIHHMAPEDKFFSLQNGIRLRNINELVDYLAVIDKELFWQHANFSKNDFATWIRDVFNAKELSNEIERALDPKEMRERIIKFF